MNGLTPYTIIPQTYWNPYAGQIPYVQQPSVAYYQPYDYQMQYPVVLAAPPTLVSQTPVINPSGPLLYAPLGPTRQESNIVYTSLGIAPRPIAPAPYPQAVIPTPILLPSQRINHQRSSSTPPQNHQRSFPASPQNHQRSSRASPQNHPGRSSLPLYVKPFF